MSKNIVICSDGTGQAGLGTTNVWRLFTALELNRPEVQIASYDPGVGAIHDPNALVASTNEVAGVKWASAVDSTPLPLRRLKRLGGLAVGAGLFENVKELYEVIVKHYEEGDRIYLFGFSRGAFTIRVLAGLIHRSGILRPEHWCRYSEAFELYEPHLESLNCQELDALQARIAAFRGSFAKPCNEISFMGLWDTVKSVGYLWPKSLPHTRRNPIVRTVRHALSIGESRSFYVPTSWGGLDTDTMPPILSQDVQEVWFVGAHADVGGGYGVDREKNRDPSLLPLRWIGDAARECGLLVNADSYEGLFVENPDLPFALHDELNRPGWKRWGWQVAERVPRWELKNDPPPPKRLFRWGPSGRRAIGRFARNGKVQIDSLAEHIYDADSPLWAAIRASGAHIVFVEGRPHPAA